MSRFASPALQAISPYVPGEQPKEGQFIKLNTNESPYPPSPRVLSALSREETGKLYLYSDPDHNRLRDALPRLSGSGATDSSSPTDQTRCLPSYSLDWLAKRSCFPR